MWTLLIILLSFFFPPSVFAEVDLRESFFTFNWRNFGFDDIGALLSIILPNAIVFSGVLFLLLIVYGGYLLIIYGGQYNAPATVSKAKAMVTYGFIGFLLVVSAYFILQIIEGVTGINFLNSPFP